MAGIYIHIPFCKQLCYYCDFHFSLIVRRMPQMIDSMMHEIRLRSGEIQQPIETVYFGGGTPSLLATDDVKRIIDHLAKYFDLSHVAECTLEANPDDLTDNYLQQLSGTMVNRLSVGIQSFHDQHLKLMNRRHSAAEAITSVKRAQNYGFNNITIDLIYGLPYMTMTQWLHNLQQFLQLDVQHLSAYHLTYEPRTAFHDMAKRNKITPASEDDSIAQYNALVECTKNNGYIHYEISNFGRQGLFSQHNTAYWQQKPYIGIGPSAHSYNGNSRRWNIADNHRYQQALQRGNLWYETEQLDTRTQYNEYMMTSLRTYWGASLLYIEQTFGLEQKMYCLKIAQQYIKQGIIYAENDSIKLSESGWLVSDAVIADFFMSKTLDVSF